VTSPATPPASPPALPPGGPDTSWRLPAAHRTGVEDRLAQAVAGRWPDRIWTRDASLWSPDVAVQAKIGDRLGWLDAPDTFRERIETLEAFADGVASEGFSAAVVCGMGGSSLAPDVLSRSFSRGAGGIPVAVLDSTDPEAVLAIVREHDPSQTLYLIATKSGTTTETLSFLHHFWELEDRLHGAIPDAKPGEHFVAISDPDRSIEAIPHNDAFRGVFLNPPDIGGRYSALTYVGLVPAALLRLDLTDLLNDAGLMAERCRPDEAINPGLALGVALGTLAAAGRDKLTLVVEPSIASFGAWAEQLIAESTGKQGVGIVPIVDEPRGAPERYGDDRVFVRLGGTSDAAWRAETDGWLDELVAAGHPVIDLTLDPTQSIGGEFFRWEFATAVAGVVLGINPFDEPNVTESKENTRRVLDEYEQTGILREEEPIATEEPLTLYGDAAMRLTAGKGSVDGELARHLERVRPSGYVAFQAYIRGTPERGEALANLRRLVRDRTRRATTAGYGPRFLHSTGQLHKGGPPTGCFIQLVADHAQDVDLADDLTFGVLIDAQARGDFVSLESHELPVLRVHLGFDPDAGLAALQDALGRALGG
jgi:transaldolase/glucose-6-phosphate isomerase